MGVHATGLTSAVPHVLLVFILYSVLDRCRAMAKGFIQCMVSMDYTTSCCSNGYHLIHVQEVVLAYYNIMGCRAMGRPSGQQGVGYDRIVDSVPWIVTSRGGGLSPATYTNDIPWPSECLVWRPLNYAFLLIYSRWPHMPRFSTLCRSDASANQIIYEVCSH